MSNDIPQSPQELLKTRIRLAADAQRPKFDIFVAIDEIFNVKGKEQPGTAQIHAPDSWANVETVAPRMVARRPTLIFKPRPDPLFRMRDENMRQAVADRQQAVWEHWWDKDAAFVKNVAWVKGALRHGTKIARTYWKYEKQTVTDYVYGNDGRPVIGEDGKFLEEEREEVTFDDACMELINSYDFFIDPEATDIQSARWIIFRYRKTLQELKEYGNFKNLSNLEGKLTNKQGEGTKHKEMSRDLMGLGSLEEDSTVDRVTCFEMWQRGKNGLEKCTIADSEVIEPWRKNPYRHRQYPFIRLIDSLIDGEFWGKGEIEPVMPMQYSLDTYHSLDVDNRIRAIDPKWKVDGDVDEAEIFEGSVIHVDTKNGDDANPIEVPDFTRTSGEGIDRTRNVMDKALGLFDVVRGESSPDNQTAQGLSIAAEQGNARFGLKIQLYEEALKELGFQVVSLYQQHKTDYFEITIKDDQGTEQTELFAPLDIAGAFNIEVESGSSRPANKEAERTDSLQEYQLAMGSPVAQDPEFQMEALKFVLDKFDGSSKLVDAADAAFKRIQMQQQAMQEQQAQMMQQDQSMQDEQGAVADHQAKMAYYDNEDKKLADEIARTEEMQGKGADREVALAGKGIA